ncbi:hypothetical protein BFG04_05490 [Campylobacter pinnipediorum subsp. pinnipediorum]|uniref:OmpR/PhoB-type domain-containing protein n=1 Tax=Campylobacter pinnipediorum subsp. pinnipediorum TaxID=1660067 RepID=A0AAX0L9D5_9BACT|nr:hypothetical protein [Campylobacter pinnipediorum]OPA75893.1 hypothetical protein BFG04_05490 [Campylobacter pinnipediorum subsp. pinnipediorum]
MRFKDLNILFVNDDDNINILLKSQKHRFKNLYISCSENFLNFYINCNTSLDMVVLDLDPFYNKNKDIDFKQILSICSHQQFIFLAKNMKTYKRILRDFAGNRSVVFFKPIKLTAIFDNILFLNKKDLKQIINLNHNVSFDVVEERLYKNDSQIFLTNLEHKLILLLIQNINKLTTFEIIDNIVYDGECPSKIAMQNLVGQLRRKLGLKIKSIRSSGYILHSFN